MSDTWEFMHEGSERTTDGLKHFVRNLSGSLVLGQGVRVVEGVV